MPTQKKEETVAELEELLKDRDIIITDYRGLTVAELREIRQALREQSVDYKVVKNTLMKIAADKLDLKDLYEFLEGPSAIAFGGEDPVQVSKTILNFAKTHKALEVKGGLLEGKAVNQDQLKALAALPPKEVLIAQLLGTLQAPIGAFVRVIAAPTQSLVTALDRIREQKEATEAA